MPDGFVGRGGWVAGAVMLIALHVPVAHWYARRYVADARRGKAGELRLCLFCLLSLGCAIVASMLTIATSCLWLR